MSFFKSFFGKDQENDIKSANKKATQNINAGAKQQNQLYDQAFGMYSPYISQGTQGAKIYSDALGINGPEAQQAAYDMMRSNPIFKNGLEQDSTAAMRMLNARGASAGGQANLALQRVFAQNSGNWLNRYKDLGDQGLLSTRYGTQVLTDKGDNAMGLGATRANMNVQYGNALANNRNTGVNNLLKVGAIAAQAANPLGSMFSSLGTGAANMFGGVSTQPGTMANGNWATQSIPNNMINRARGIV